MASTISAGENRRGDSTTSRASSCTAVGSCGQPRSKANPSSIERSNRSATIPLARSMTSRESSAVLELPHRRFEFGDPLSLAVCLQGQALDLLQRGERAALAVGAVRFSCHLVPLRAVCDRALRGEPLARGVRRYGTSAPDQGIGSEAEFVIDVTNCYNRLAPGPCARIRVAPTPVPSPGRDAHDGHCAPRVGTAARVASLSRAPRPRPRRRFWIARRR